MCNEQKQLPVLLIGPSPTLSLYDPHYPSFPLDIPAQLHAEINLLSSIASYPSMPVSSGFPPYFKRVQHRTESSEYLEMSLELGPMITRSKSGP